METAVPRPQRTKSRRVAVVLGASVATAALVPLSLDSQAGAAAPAPAPAAAVQLVDNGGFEDGTAGWRTNRKRQVLKATRPAVTGSSSARLRVTIPGRIVLRNSRPSVTEADPTATYTLTAQVRSTGRVIDGKLRVREVSNGEVLVRHLTRFRAGDGWKRVRLTFSPRRSAGLDVSIAGERLNTSIALLVDDISLTSNAGIEPTPPPDIPTSCVSDPMGIPEPGTTYLGAAVSGTSSLEEREADFGRKLPLHRTYYQANQISASVRQATADLKAGRLPWISFKAPLSWAEMAAGNGNDWARQLADGLATVPGPVWLAVHHEPEGDGDMALWTEMQRQIARIIHDRTDNVAYSLIYSGWNTYGGGKDNVATKWPGDQYIDILGIDAYNDYGAMRNGRLITNSLEIRTYFEKMAAWAEAHGTAWAVAETAQTAAGADHDPGWMARAYRDMKALGGAGMSWFDSSQHSVADWTLDYHLKFKAYDRLLPESVRLCP